MVYRQWASWLTFGLKNQILILLLYNGGCVLNKIFASGDGLIGAKKHKGESHGISRRSGGAVHRMEVGPGPK
jgi:hypothetical protein